MKKKLFKTTFFLLLYSSIAKLLSFLVRIFLARSLSAEAMNYYTLAMPTMLLLITLAQMGIPGAMSKLLADQNHHQETLKASLIFSVVNNLLLLVIMILLIPILANVIFKQNVLIPVLTSCLAMIPLVTLSGLCKGYLLGKQRMLLYSSSQITEEIFRIGFLLITLPLTSNPVVLTKLAIYSMAAGELGSFLHMLIGILFKRKIHFKIFHCLPNKAVYAALLSVALPMTFSRLIGSFSYFLEPIVMLLKVSKENQNAMVDTFTMLNSYVQPILTMPSFATVMISNWALPAYSEANQNSKKKKSIFFLSCGFSLSISLFWSIILYFFPEWICQIIYKKNEMVPMLKQLSVPFVLYGAQPVLSSLIHGIGKSKLAFIDTTIGCLIRLILMIYLPLIIQEQSIPTALILSMLTTTLLHFFHVVCDLFFQHK